MNEVRNILVGFDFGEKVSQLCYYDRREGEPVSLPVKVGTGQYTFPNVLSKKPVRGMALRPGSRVLCGTAG